MNNNYHPEAVVEKILKMIPCDYEFDRMAELALKDIEGIVGPKPVFKCSQIEAIKMDREDYKEKFVKWSSDSADWQLSAYDKFVQWNQNCILNLSEDELKHLEWLCDWIAENRVHNVDMEDCGEFSTEGIYFNKDKKLVIYNGR
jgi:hypothetical protein